MIAFKVWLTSYPGGAMRVEAVNWRVAVRMAAHEWRAHWHGETIEVNVREDSKKTLDVPIITRPIRISPTGAVSIGRYP